MQLRFGVLLQLIKANLNACTRVDHPWAPNEYSNVTTCPAGVEKHILACVPGLTMEIRSGHRGNTREDERIGTMIFLARAG